MSISILKLMLTMCWIRVFSLHCLRGYALQKFLFDVSFVLTYMLYTTLFMDYGLRYALISKQ